MSLKTDFFDGLTGLHSKLNDAFDEGVDFVGSNLSALSSAATANAANGNTKYTVTIITNFNPSALRANKGANLLWKAYSAGILKGLSDQQVYSYEVAVALNVVDSVDTKVDFNFNFQTT